jgi:ubiquinone/menaquinone biosynthesis C-methylase UbiE
MSAKSFYEHYYTDLDVENRRWRERGGAAKAQNIIAIAADMPARTVIEIGGGTGAVLANLARSSFGAQFWVLDIAEEAIELIRRRDDLPGLVEARVFDGAHIPYQDKQFDLAILSHVVEHVAAPRSLLLEAARVAHYVAVEVPLEDNLYTFLKVRIFKSDYRERIGHVQWFSQHSFKYLLETVCNLNVVRMRVVYVPDELYFMRKKGISRIIISIMLYLRKTMRLLSDGLYTRLLTDHCIALVCSHR